MEEQPRVAIYALCERGDNSSLILARNVCDQNGWSHLLEYVDTNKAQAYSWKDLLADIALGDFIQILVTYHVSEKLEKYCQQYNCTVVRAMV